MTITLSKQMCFGIFAGFISAGAVFTAVSKAQDEQNLLLTECQVEVGRGQMHAGYRCRANEVMVGKIDQNIYCAKIKVSCGAN